MIETTILIVGAGPAGTTTSFFLSKNKINHYIIDKAEFPRDKTCGDALSGKVMSILKKMDVGFELELKADKQNFIDSWGVKFASPNGKFINVPFRSTKRTGDLPPGYISKRFNFDNYLFEKLNRDFATVKTDLKVIDIYRDKNKVIVHTENEIEKLIFCADLVIGADGAQSVIAKKLGNLYFDDNFYSAGVRCYFKNISDLHPENYIELLFLKNINPGYLWIFPLPNNEANVGLGIPKMYLNENNRQLKMVMFDIIKNDPTLSKRFKNAELISDVKGWGLPLGKVGRPISGERFLLVGDAAQLIDPFTGEGIGNAMLSGMIAAETAKEAVNQGYFSAEFLKKYDQIIYSKIGDELKLSDRLQKLSSKTWLFNFIINKANKSASFRELLTYMFENIDVRAKLSSPIFYLKLLFNR